MQEAPPLHLVDHVGRSSSLERGLHVKKFFKMLNIRHSLIEFKNYGD